MAVQNILREAEEGCGCLVHLQVTRQSRAQRYNWRPSTEYFYFNGHLMAELNPATGAFTNYVCWHRVARRDGTTGPVSYYFSDHLKTASVISDSTGNNITAESDYYPWGGETPVRQQRFQPLQIHR